MSNEPKETTRAERPSGDLGFTRTPTENDPRRDPNAARGHRAIAPGTRLRQAIDDIIRSHEGALIVLGDPQELAFLYSGGIRLDAPFRPQLLYELAKMDGAIIVDTAVKRLAWANVQLMPDPTIPSDETGTRHRTAERVAKQTGALVISVSQQRETVTIFVGPRRYQLDPRRRRPRQDEPGARHARDLPPAARAGAHPAHGARVPERGRPRRRARHPPAGGDDLTHVRADPARLRRARQRGPADPPPARRARRQRPGRARRDRPRLPRGRSRRRGDAGARGPARAPLPRPARVRPARRAPRLRPR